jgi:hypothetical protein
MAGEDEAKREEEGKGVIEGLERRMDFGIVRRRYPGERAPAS